MIMPFGWRRLQSDAHDRIGGLRVAPLDGCCQVAGLGVSCAHGTGRLAAEDQSGLELAGGDLCGRARHQPLRRVATGRRDLGVQVAKTQALRRFASRRRAAGRKRHGHHAEPLDPFREARRVIEGHPRRAHGHLHGIDLNLALDCLADADDYRDPRIILFTHARLCSSMGQASLSKF